MVRKRSRVQIPETAYQVLLYQRLWTFCSQNVLKIRHRYVIYIHQLSINIYDKNSLNCNGLERNCSVTKRANNLSGDRELIYQINFAFFIPNFCENDKLCL